MKPKTIVLMIVAVGFGLVAAWATTQIGARSPTKTVDLLVAKKDIAQGTLLKDPNEYFQIKKELEENAPKNAIYEMDKLKGKVVLEPIPANSFATPTALGDKIGLKVTKGMRAIAIQVTSAQVAGGFVLPNSRVDVLMTSRGSNGQAKSESVLANVRVLAVDTINRQDASKESYVPTTVTVEVSPEDALKLSSAKDQGRLELSLRSWEDADSTAGSGTTPSSPQQYQTEEVWVASKRIEPGTKLEDIDGLLKRKPFLKAEVPENAINVRDQLKNKTLRRVVEANQFFTEEDFKEIVKPEAVGTPPPPRKHIMIIVNGSNSVPVEFQEKSAGVGEPNENRTAPPGADPDKKATPPTGGSEGK